MISRFYWKMECFSGFRMSKESCGHMYNNIFHRSSSDVFPKERLLSQNPRGPKLIDFIVVFKSYSPNRPFFSRSILFYLPGRKKGRTGVERLAKKHRFSSC